LVGIKEDSGLRKGSTSTTSTALVYAVSVTASATAAETNDIEQP
jgi:hypothetical protein